LVCLKFGSHIRPQPSRLGLERRKRKGWGGGPAVTWRTVPGAAFAGIPLHARPGRAGWSFGKCFNPWRARLPKHSHVLRRVEWQAELGGALVYAPSHGGPNQVEHCQYLACLSDQAKRNRWLEPPRMADRARPSSIALISIPSAGPYRECQDRASLAY
jgi:hypothetical protein